MACRAAANSSLQFAAQGVEREIKLCNTHNIRQMLIIEHEVEIPSCFDSRKAYQRFDPQQPAEPLSEVYCRCESSSFDPFVGERTVGPVMPRKAVGFLQNRTSGDITETKSQGPA